VAGSALRKASKRSCGSMMRASRTRAACWSCGSGRNRGSDHHSNRSVEIEGSSNSSEVAEVVARPALASWATTSRSTPSICTRISSALANRSSGEVAQALSSSR
jgi:hypothetical protein